MCCLFEEIDGKIPVSFAQGAFILLLWYADLKQMIQILNGFLTLKIKQRNKYPYRVLTDWYDATF